MVIGRGVLVLDVTEVDFGVGSDLVSLVAVVVVDVVVVVVVVVIISMGLNTQDSPSIGKYCVSALWR